MKYTMTFIALTLMICVSLSDPAHGQTVNNYIYNYNIYNGLPSNRIYDIITDKHGYLWIATEKGVVKYNGYEFKVFGTSDGLPTDDV